MKVHLFVLSELREGPSLRWAHLLDHACRQPCISAAMTVLTYTDIFTFTGRIRGQDVRLNLLRVRSVSDTRGAHGAFRRRDAHRHECDASDAFLDGAAHAFIDDAAEAFGVAASGRGAIKREEKF